MPNSAVALSYHIRRAAVLGFSGVSGAAHLYWLSRSSLYVR